MVQGADGGGRALLVPPAAEAEGAGRQQWQPGARAEAGPSPTLGAWVAGGGDAEREGGELGVEASEAGDA